MFLSVQGPSEGELVLECSPTDLRGTLKVEISPKVEDNCVLLYRLRVKEASLLFSKTYGALATKGPHSRSEEITICAKAAVAESKNISTIRVEFISVGKADAPAQADVQKNDVKHFFEKGGVLHYDIKCVVKKVAEPTPTAKKKKYAPRHVAFIISSACVAGLVAWAVRNRASLIAALRGQA